MPKASKQRRREAIVFVADTIGNDMLTTHEIWEVGQSMIARGVTWPPYTKRAFVSFRTPAALGLMMSRHPDFAKVGTGAVRMGGIRTQLWRRR